jgi:ABC-2 type transport system ATP-binding protein
VALPLVEVDSVEKTFGRVRAVEAFSMEVGAGELVALVGPNGAGKTTKLRMIIEMLRPDSGRIVYGLGGVPSVSVDSCHIGYLPEERGLYTDVPVRRVLIYFAALRGMERPEAAQEASHWLDPLGLGTGRGNRWGVSPRGISRRCSSFRRSSIGPLWRSWTSPSRGWIP